MNKKGYTAVELLILFVIVGVIAILAISNVTHAFGNKEGVSLRENAFNIIEAQAKEYGEKNSDLFKEDKEVYLTVDELINAGYLLKDNEKTILGFDDLGDKKIKISKSDDKVEAIILNRE